MDLRYSSDIEPTKQELEEIEEMQNRIYRTFFFRTIRAALFLMATLFVWSWLAPDYSGPALTLTMIGVPVLAWIIDVVLDKFWPEPDTKRLG